MARKPPNAGTGANPSQPTGADRPMAPTRITSTGVLQQSVVTTVPMPQP